MSNTEIALLFSGGKDSSLAAYLLENKGYAVKLVTATFGINEDWKNAREVAVALGFHHEVIKLDQGALEEAHKIIKKEGYPRGGISHIHKSVLNVCATKYKVLADGTRRGDHSPRLAPSEIRSLEDFFNIEYIAPLHGFGPRSINRMCHELFVIEEGESSKINKGDYEGELRTFLKKKGLEIEKIFPSHIQSRVISWRNK